MTLKRKNANGTWSTIVAGGASTWGSITGTLSSQTDLQTALDGKSTVSVAATGTATDSIKYITVDGTEKKIIAESIPVYDTEPESSAVAEGEVFATPDGDDVSPQQMIFDVTYPVGYIFIQRSTTDNPNTLWQALGIAATWTDCTSEFDNRYEMASTTNAAGTQIAAGLPNIKGSVTKMHTASTAGAGEGAISTTEFSGASLGVGTGYAQFTVNFNAHNSNAIYSDDVTTVTPLTSTIKYWRRTA